MKKLKGKGELIRCPFCGSDNISANPEKDWFGGGMCQNVECENCKKEFRENWKPISWEEL